MNRIQALHLRSLHNNEHHQFMTDVSSTISKYTPEELGVAGIFLPFSEALAAEKSALMVEIGSTKSAELERLDTGRDLAWEAIELRVESAEMSPLDDEKPGAQAIRRILTQYGDPRRLPYNEESSLLSNFTTDLLKTENASHLETLNLIRLVPALKALNDQFISLMLDRYAELSQRGEGNVKKMRATTDPLYTQMVEIVNARLTLGTAGEPTKAFINELNEMVSKYKAMVNSRQAIAKKGKTNPTTTAN